MLGALKIKKPENQYSGEIHKRSTAPAAVPGLRKAVIPFIAICLTAPAPSSASPQSAAQNLTDLTLEQLGNIEITSVSKRAEALSHAAAAIYVIFAEDIRRAGVTSLPEALRLAPNLQVARADNNQYSISARGFNSTTANNLLVLIDGRTVYSPLYSGVFWEAQDVMLEDIDRIEVISGPGGTLWGSNAVSGVINISTRAADKTQGTLLAAGGGNREKQAAARYGGELASGGHYRIYGKYSDRNHTSRANGVSIRDDSDKGQAGFRSDWNGAQQQFTVQGDAYSSDIDQGLTTREISGANLLGRWNRTLDNGADLQLQAYYDRTERRQPGAINDTLDTFDIDFQHHLQPLGNHNVVWGGGYRYYADRVENINLAALAFLPADKNQALANIYVQDQITLQPALKLTPGLKVEHNDYTGIEILPSVRLGWEMHEGHFLWAAASRVVRAPARLDRELFSPGRPPFVGLAGNPNFQSEVTKVYEIGYRGQPSTAFSYSVTVYHNDFDRLRSLEPTAAGPMFDNKIAGNANGVEAWGSYRVSNTWRLDASVVGQHRNLALKPGSGAVNFNTLGNDPTHWWRLRSAWDLGPHHEFDLTLRHVGALPTPAVPAYTAVDARLGWQVSPEVEISVTAQNLFDPEHPEWGTAATRPEFQRGVFLKILWLQ